MDKLERIQYGLQFSPSAVNNISSKRSSKKTQKKVKENTWLMMSSVFFKKQTFGDKYLTNQYQAYLFLFYAFFASIYILSLLFIYVKYFT